MVRLNWWNLLPMLAMLVVVLVANISLAQQQFPYVAYITKQDSYVRSGPGQKYYPTQQLPQGHAVEVYRHDGDRWCAIRPPEGSFSVIASHQVNQLGQGVAEVSAQQVITRVGSLMSTERGSIQVLLPRGERVKVLDSASADGVRWLRISPPSGEFRWIAAEDLSAQPPIETAPPMQARTGWSRPSEVAKTAHHNLVEQTSGFGHLTESPNVIPNSETVSIPGSANHSPLATKDDDTLDIVVGSPAELQLAQFQEQDSGLPEALLESSPPLSAAPLLSSQQSLTGGAPRIRFQGQAASSTPATPWVAELELRLSEIVVRSPAEWNFAQVKNEANSLLVNTNVPAERNRLRDVLDRITRFEQVQQGYRAVPKIAQQPITLAQATPITPQTLAMNPAVAPASNFSDRSSKILDRVKEDLGVSPAVASHSAGATTKKLYDATGILKPVVSKRSDAPQFALVNDRGDVVSFVTPTPDLNLQPYLGQRIGVNGTREYNQEFRRAHVAAGKITPLEGTLRR